MSQAPNSYQGDFYFGADLYNNVEIGELVFHVDSIVGPKPVGLVVNIVDIKKHMENPFDQRYWVFVFIEGNIWGDWIDYWESASNYFG